MCIVTLKYRRVSAQLKDIYIALMKSCAEAEMFRVCGENGGETAEEVCVYMDVNGWIARDRPRKTWEEVLRNYLKVKDLTRSSKGSCNLQTSR